MIPQEVDDLQKPKKFLSVANRRRVFVGLCVIIAMGAVAAVVGSLVAVTFYECEKDPFTRSEVFTIDPTNVTKLQVSMPPIRDSHFIFEEDNSFNEIQVNITRIISRDQYFDDFDQEISSSGKVDLKFKGFASYVLGCPKYNLSITAPRKKYNLFEAKSINSHYITDGIYAKRAHLQSTAGGISLSNFNIDKLFATTAKGEVDLKDGTSSGYLNVSSQLTGDIRMTSSESSDVRAKALNGRIVVTNLTCLNEAEFTTSRGQIDIFSIFMESYQSMLNLVNDISGKIRVDMFPKGSITGSSMGGDIDVILPGDYEGEITMSSNQGQVAIDGYNNAQYAQDTESKKQVEIGNGNRDVKLNSQTGDITVSSESTIQA
eukprot:gb/GECH01013294.1/.p1 GENE.gb/GECH01013294.1/~~gb/GECH01013294.1/.p1  ORF type:complete len:374 (+),score=55.90 gb/GECH01013294.1/:1-1122(+)